VTTLDSTFWDAYSFNQDLSAWDTSKVTTLACTFHGATSFNQPLK
jgi:surface protein